MIPEAFVVDISGIMGESGPDESDYSYDLDEDEFQGDMDYTDNLSNSSDSYEDDGTPEEEEEMDVVQEVLADARIRAVPALYALDPGSRYSTDSGSGQSLSSTRALLNDSATPKYAPERWPAWVDFLFVFSSFIAAVVAAYYTLI